MAEMNDERFEDLAGIIETFYTPPETDSAIMLTELFTYAQALRKENQRMRKENQRLESALRKTVAALLVAQSVEDIIITAQKEKSDG